MLLLKEREAPCANRGLAKYWDCYFPRVYEKTNYLHLCANKSENVGNHGMFSIFQHVSAWLRWLAGVFASRSLGESSAKEENSGELFCKEPPTKQTAPRRKGTPVFGSSGNGGHCLNTNVESKEPAIQTIWYYICISLYFSCFPLQTCSKTFLRIPVALLQLLFAIDFMPRTSTKAERQNNLFVSPRLHIHRTRNDDCLRACYSRFLVFNLILRMTYMACCLCMCNIYIRYIYIYSPNVFGCVWALSCKPQHWLSKPNQHLLAGRPNWARHPPTVSANCKFINPTNPQIPRAFASQASHDLVR